MKTPLLTTVLAASLYGFLFTSCDSKQEDAREDTLENKADAAENKADAVRDAAERQADAIEDKADATRDAK